jgi:putative flippase GtrA
MIDALLQRLAPEHRALFWSFLRFGIVGVSGLPVDTAVVYISRTTLGIYAAGALAYLVAATWTFAFNRFWTFREHAHGAIWRQWIAFLGANLPGMALNRGAFFILVTVSPFCATYFIIPVAVGAVTGMSANFIASRRLVFRAKTTPSSTSR